MKKTTPKKNNRTFGRRMADGGMAPAPMQRPMRPQMPDQSKRPDRAPAYGRNMNPGTPPDRGRGNAYAYGRANQPVGAAPQQAPATTQPLPTGYNSSGINPAGGYPMMGPMPMPLPGGAAPSTSATLRPYPDQNIYDANGMATGSTNAYFNPADFAQPTTAKTGLQGLAGATFTQMRRGGVVKGKTMKAGGLVGKKGSPVKKYKDGGKVDSGKGYTSDERKALKRLIEMSQPDVGDYVGSESVTYQKKKKMKGGGLARKGVGVALKGGGLARKGVGMALKKGGIVGAPARSARDMRAGAGSGVGRIQKTKIARGR